MAWFYLGFLIVLIGLAYIDFLGLISNEMLWIKDHHLVIGILFLFLLLPLTIHRHSHKSSSRKSARTDSS
jgi:hypothetical protein